MSQQPKRPTTVGDLIAELGKYPADMRVLVDGYEGGLDDPQPTRILECVETRDERTYFGWYGSDGDVWDEDAGVPPFRAVVIPR